MSIPSVVGRTLVLLIALAPLAALAQDAPRPSADGLPPGFVVEYHVDARIRSEDGAMPLDVLDALGASRHLLRMDVQPLGNVYGVSARFTFQGMDAFRAWHDAPETVALLGALRTADVGSSLQSSLVVQRSDVWSASPPER